MSHMADVQPLEAVPYFLVSRSKAVLWPKGQSSRCAHDAQGGAVVLWPTGQGPRPTTREGKERVRKPLRGLVSGPDLAADPHVAVRPDLTLPDGHDLFY